MDKLILTPPVAFIIVLVAVFIFAKALSALSFRKRVIPNGERKSYACGEDVPSHLMQPDYEEFFPFAFFFTILHVVALVITTMPIATMGTFTLALVYVSGAVISLVIVFRR